VYCRKIISFLEIQWEEKNYKILFDLVTLAWIECFGQIFFVTSEEQMFVTPNVSPADKCVVYQKYWFKKN
jgi:hypothetical protein